MNTYKRFSEFLKEEYVDTFLKKSYLKSNVDIFVNPNRKELKDICKENLVARSFINENGDVYVFSLDVLHATIFEDTKYIDKNAISLVLYFDKSFRYIDIMVTDFVKNTKWYHNKDVYKNIMENKYLSKMFSIDGVSYYDESIVGDWADLEDE